MTRYLMLEQTRLEADIAALDDRLSRVHRGPGLKARSVRSFLDALRRHKREMLRALDERLSRDGARLN